jgi:hypothetical protein
MSNLSNLSLRIVVNGTDHSFQREFGCNCGRCRNPYFRANTSVSLIAVYRDNEVVWHALIDAGSGVINNLFDNLSVYQGEPRVDTILLTHWHPDHTLGLNQLCESLHRSRERLGLTADNKIPLWCRSGTKARLNNSHSYELGRFLDLAGIEQENEPPGRLLNSLEFPDVGVEIQPITTSHVTADLGGMYCTAGSIVSGPKRCAGLIWDLDNQNDWILSPSPAAREARRCLGSLNVLFMDCNTWQVEEVGGKNTGHIGFERLQRYVNALQPRETVLIHLSGHEDGLGNQGWGWSNAEWELNAREHWSNSPGHVCDESWPDAVSLRSPSCSFLIE